MKSIIYARTATTSQDKPINSIAHQIAQCIDKLERENLLDTHTAIYGEVHSGASLSRLQRSILGRLNPGGCVVVTEPSRISRNIGELAYFAAIVSKRGSKLIFCNDDPFQTLPASIASGELNVTIKGD